MRERKARYGLTALCIGLGMGCAVLWEGAQPTVRESGPVEGVRENREVPPTALDESD
jgi:hypothetical protein